MIGGGLSHSVNRSTQTPQDCFVYFGHLKAPNDEQQTFGDGLAFKNGNDDGNKLV